VHRGIVALVERTFSEDDANALLPQLNDLLPRLQQAFETFRGSTEDARRRAASNGSSPEAATKTGSGYMQLLAEVTDMGVILRDPETGLCDFPAVRDGEPVFLCWRLGEERVGFWHSRDAGAAGRQPL
jgi:hypothetical protein